MTNMLGVAAERKLAIACEQRLGQIVQVATLFELGQICSPTGSVKPRKPFGAAIALTDTDIWLLELRFWVIGFTVGRVIGRCPRAGLAAHWRHRRWAWPNVWKAELSWPDTAQYVEGTLMSGQDVDRLIGVLAADEFHRKLAPRAPGAERARTGYGSQLTESATPRRPYVCLGVWRCDLRPQPRLRGPGRSN